MNSDADAAAVSGAAETAFAGLDRRAAVARLLRNRAGAVVITGLGNPTFDVAALGDHPRNMPLWGAMGGAAAMGLGLALAQPETLVIVITGDGEMLMGAGSLAVIAQQAPANLRIVVLDNGAYGETGGQVAHTAAGADLAAIARGCGFAEAATARTEAELEALAARLHAPANGPGFAVVKIAPGSPPREDAVANAPRDGGHVRARLRLALGLSAD